MAVVRSQAFSNARKSIGQVNYYRRAGVQLSRQKATFPPGRVFTQSQINQQDRMKAVYSVLHTMRGIDMVDYCNTSANKLYNAASRSNRMSSAVLRNMRYWNPVIYNDASEYALLKLQDVTSGFSIGNLPNFVTHVAAASSGEVGPGAIFFYVTIDMIVLNQALNKVNKRRSRNSSLTWNNIGLCGFAGTNVVGGSGDQYYNSFLPCMAKDFITQGEYTLLFEGNSTEPCYDFDNIVCNIVLFFVDTYDPDLLIPLTKSFFSTSSITKKIERV